MPVVPGVRARVPGTVTAARVLIVLSGVGGLLWGVIGLAGGLFALSLSRSVGADGDDLGTLELGAFGVATLGDLAVFAVVGGVLSIVLAIVDFVCATRLGRGNRGARGLFTGTVVADHVLGVVLAAAVDPQLAVQLVISVPWSLLVLGLLWLTASARRFFEDEPPAPDPISARTTQQPPAPSASSPFDLPTPPLGLPLRPADVVVPAQVARFCPQCGQPTTPGDAFCGHCGTFVRVGTPAAPVRG